MYTNNIFFQEADNLVLAQYIPSELHWKHNGTLVKVSLIEDQQLDSTTRPESLAYYINVSCDNPQEFSLKIRLPWWISSRPDIFINGAVQETRFEPSSYISLKRVWSHDSIRIVLPKALIACPLPDRSDLVSFMDGPVVLAGVLDHGHHHDGKDLLEEKTLFGDQTNPCTILVPDNVREWTFWRGGYRTQNQPQNIQFVPIYTIRDERYAVYFPVKAA
jgi:DUF1680 family protein